VNDPMNTFPAGRWTSRPTYQELERAGQKRFNNLPVPVLAEPALQNSGASPMDGGEARESTNHQSRLDTCADSRGGQFISASESGSSAAVEASGDTCGTGLLGSNAARYPVAGSKTGRNLRTGTLASEFEGMGIDRTEVAANVAAPSVPSLFRRLFRRNRRRHNLARWLSVSGAVQ
jgi:hypothetical protein